MTAEYIAYIDESGDTGLVNIDDERPGFAVAVALYPRGDYCAHELSLFTDLKFRLFGHDAVIFHSYAMRQRAGPFIRIKHEPEFEAEIFERLTFFFKNSRATLVMAVVNKRKHVEKYKYPDDPYHLGIKFCLERVHDELALRGAADAKTHLVFESRGKKEDAIMRQWCEAICAGANYRGKKFNFAFAFADKKQNMTGLQVADLAAFTAARYAESLNEERKDWQAIKHLIRKDASGAVLGYGLKVFP